MPDKYPYQCQHCECRRLDELEERVAELWTFFESYRRMEARQLQHQRLMVAREGGTLISRRDIQRMTGVSRETVLLWGRDPTFPPRVRPGSGTRPDLYSKEQVSDWLDEHYRLPKVKAALRRKQALAELEAEKQKGQDD